MAEAVKQDETDGAGRVSFPGARFLAGSCAFFWSAMFWGIVDLTVPFDTEPRQVEQFYDFYLLETGWGLLFTVVLPVPFVALAFRPRSPLLVIHLWCVAMVLMITALLAFSWGQLVPAGVLALMAWGQGALALESKWWRGLRLRRIGVVPAVLEVAVWVCAAAYAASMVAEARAGTPDDDSWGIRHLPMQAAFGLSVAVAASLAARGAAARATMWPVLLAVAAVSGAWLGALSLAYPGHLGSLGRQGGIAALVWSALFAVSVPLTVLWHVKGSRAASRP